MCILSRWANVGKSRSKKHKDSSFDNPSLNKRDKKANKKKLRMNKSYRFERKHNSVSKKKHLVDNLFFII